MHGYDAWLICLMIFFRLDSIHLHLYLYLFPSLFLFPLEQQHLSDQSIIVNSECECYVMLVAISLRMCEGIHMFTTFHILWFHSSSLSTENTYPPHTTPLPAICHYPKASTKVLPSSIYLNLINLEYQHHEVFYSKIHPLHTSIYSIWLCNAATTTAAAA